MSITSYARRLAGQTCHNLTEQFTPSFGDPVSLAFGDVADEGDSDDFARADHRHGMPDQGEFIDDLEVNATIFNEMMLTATTNDVKVVGTVAFGGRDDVGEISAFGSLDLTTAAVAGSSAGIYFQNSSGGGAGNTTSQVHPFRRTKQFLARVRPAVDNVTNPNSIQVAVGFIRSSSAADIVRNITDGVYFFLDTDAVGAGNYFAVTMSNGTSVPIDTGVTWRSDGAGSVKFDLFRITFDGTTVVFYINGTQVASTTSNIPTSARKMAGFGAWITTEAAAAKTMVVDVVAWTGSRVYTE